MGQNTTNADVEDPEDIDADGEYEEDDMGYGHITQAETQEDGNTTDAEGSDVDAEGEEVDEDDSEPVGAVKIAAPEDAVSDEEEEQDEDAAGDSFSDAKTSYSEDDTASSELSEAEGQWQAGSEDGEEPDVERQTNLCA